MLPDPYYYAVKSLFSTNLRFGNYVISGSCKTMSSNCACKGLFGNYLISGAVMQSVTLFLAEKCCMCESCFGDTSLG